MSKGNIFENDFLKLIFNGTAIPNIADNAASGSLTSIWVSLHTGDPGEGGNQTTNETTYGTYARAAVSRSTSGWVVNNNEVSPGADVLFSQATSGTATITHVAVGTASAGTGKVLYKGAVTPNIAIAVGVSPRLTTASKITED